MPASKRRRAAVARRAATVAATPDDAVAGGASPRATSRAASPAEATVRAAAQAPARRPSVRAPRPTRVPASTNPDDEPRWSPLGLLALLTMAFALQLPIGVLIHYTSHANLLIIDMFFFQPQYILLACFLAMPVARIITHQPRALRLLESLSLGAVYALLALLLATSFVHPNNGTLSSSQFVRHLQVSDGLRIAVSDVLALFGTVAFFPGLNRLLGAPGRRARARMVKRADAAASRGATPARGDIKGGPRQPR